MGFEPTVTLTRHSGFQVGPWFGVRNGSYLGFQRVYLLRHPRSSPRAVQRSGVPAKARETLAFSGHISDSEGMRDEIHVYA